ncbi:MAG: aminotransferase class V-fold PLP-dependent enzyme [Caldilineaceae bacterium]|nr:aminotransferase class V-fold PLP-dependent enzyme [Caldilineaceae bacterium]
MATASDAAVDQIRAEFLLRDDWRLLNNGSFGACPQPVFAAYQAWQAELEKHPGGYMGHIRENMTAARTRLADYLHTDQSRLAFVTNATMGVNAVTHSLRSWLKPGDEVLTTNHEYGACNHAWQFNCGKAGAHYINHPIQVPLQSDADFIDQLWAGVTPRTRVIYLSHTTSPTALTFPLEAICRRAREAGILTVIDGAHVPGQRDLFLDELGADFYTGNCHKWMCAPKGTAFLHVRDDVQHLIEPLIVGHGWLPEQRSEQPLVDYVEQYGTRDFAGFLAVPAAIDYLAAHDWPAVRTRCYTMALGAKRVIEEHFDTETICPESFDWFSQLCPIRLPDQTDMGKLGEIFRNQYQIEMPLINWNGVKIARLSVQIYTTQAEIDTFVEAALAHVAACQA